jgi:hypothetical protein
VISSLRVMYNPHMQQARRLPNWLTGFLKFLGWSRSSSVLLAGFFLTCGLIVYVWWPLAQEALAFVDWHGRWWLYMDWLLLGIFAFMSLTIITHASLGRDALIVLVGMIGGLVIEAWGTQTNLWFYYTAERPPLWIIPAWPIASLSIDRLTRALSAGLTLFTDRIKASSRQNLPGNDHQPGSVSKMIYLIIFGSFFLLLLLFTAPTFDKIATIMSVLLVALLILTPTDHGFALLTFLAGSGLGYFLELWGTTRQCWTYYTYQTPPLFAVLAHGMAAVAFWRAGLLVGSIYHKIRSRLVRQQSPLLGPRTE